MSALQQALLCYWGGEKEENPTLFQVHSPNKQSALNKSASQWAVKRCSMLSMTVFHPQTTPALIKWWIYEYSPTTHVQRKWGKANFNYAFLFVLSAGKAMLWASLTWLHPLTPSHFNGCLQHIFQLPCNPSLMQLCVKIVEIWEIFDLFMAQVASTLDFRFTFPASISI